VTDTYSQAELIEAVEKSNIDPPKKIALELALQEHVELEAHSSLLEVVYDSLHGIFGSKNPPPAATVSAPLSPAVVTSQVSPPSTAKPAEEHDIVAHPDIKELLKPAPRPPVLQSFKDAMERDADAKAKLSEKIAASGSGDEGFVVSHLDKLNETDDVLRPPAPDAPPFIPPHPADIPETVLFHSERLTIVWTPSPNFSVRSAKVSLIVIHDCEGGFDSATRTFLDKNSKNPVSAHFVISEDGKTVRQMVALAEKAWHAMAFNSRSVGIEMAGFEAKGFSDAEWSTEAALTAYLCHELGVPPVWSKAGLTPGVTRHLDLGAAGGGHTDPTRDPAKWEAFLLSVKKHYDDLATHNQNLKLALK